VRGLISRHDLTAAEGMVRSYQMQAGVSPELAASLSWIARGAFDSGQLDRADNYASAARNMTLGLVRNGRLDADPWLPVALGNSVEVQAGVMANRGDRPGAIAFLRQQLNVYGNTSIAERIRKNLNLLGMEGKPAPALDTAEYLGPKPPSLASLRGRPV